MPRENIILGKGLEEITSLGTQHRRYLGRRAKHNIARELYVRLPDLQFRGSLFRPLESVFRYTRLAIVRVRPAIRLTILCFLPIIVRKYARL